jgi:hypothetical protein
MTAFFGIPPSQGPRPPPTFGGGFHPNLTNTLNNRIARLARQGGITPDQGVQLVVVAELRFQNERDAQAKRAEDAEAGG